MRNDTINERVNPDGVNGICGHQDCLRDEPHDLVLRRFVGTDYVEVWCTNHDPLDDPGQHEYWTPA